MVIDPLDYTLLQILIIRQIAIYNWTRITLNWYLLPPHKRRSNYKQLTRIEFFIYPFALYKTSTVYGFSFTECPWIFMLLVTHYQSFNDKYKRLSTFLNSLSLFLSLSATLSWSMFCLSPAYNRRRPLKRIRGIFARVKMNDKLFL